MRVALGPGSGGLPSGSPIYKPAAGSEVALAGKGWGLALAAGRLVKRGGGGGSCLPPRLSPRGNDTHTQQLINSLPAMLLCRPAASRLARAGARAHTHARWEGPPRSCAAVVPPHHPGPFQMPPLCPGRVGTAEPGAPSVCMLFGAPSQQITVPPAGFFVFLSPSHFR